MSVHVQWARLKNFCLGLVKIVGGLALCILAAAVAAAGTLRFSDWIELEVVIWVIAAAVLVFGVDQIMKGLPLLRPRFTDAPGTARMGARTDLKKSGLLAPRVFGEQGQGIYCGSFKGRKVFYDGDRHAISMAPTRSGKDTMLLIPNMRLLDQRSIIVMDPKGEVAAVTKRYRDGLGPTLVFNPKGVLTNIRPDLASCGFNPFAVPSFMDDLFGNTSGLAAAGIPLSSSTEKHWPLGARELFQCLCLRAKLDRPNDASLSLVNEMLRLPYASAEPNARTLQKLMMSSAAHHNRELARLANQFTNGSREIDSIISSARVPLTHLNDNVLLADLDKHPKIRGRPFDFEMMKHEVITVYIILPDDQLKKYSFWLRMIVGHALDSLKKTPPGSNNPLFMINEAGNLGHLESLEEGMGMAAGKGITLWTLWQSLGQIRQLYGPDGASAFMSGAGLLNAFGGVDLETAKYLSERMGRKTEVSVSYNQHPDDKAPGKNETASGYELRSVHDIMGMEDGKLLSWIRPAAQPFDLDAKGYFDMDGMSGLDPNPYYRKAGRHGKAA